MNSIRKNAMLWWSDLGSATKTYICDTEQEILGSIRRWETLTGSEIQKLYLLTHSDDV